MTVSIDGVRIRRRSRYGSFAIIIAEIVLSFFVYVSFAAHILWPEASRAAAGVSSLLSYEGRLMDTSGNPLGGTGEPYCFRFSIYDTESAGSKLWPAGTPNVTVATTTDGVFNALVGQADALSYNFYDNSSVYLNVEVNTATSTNGSTCSGSWETLSPRQTVAATGYARTAENVYSTTLFTDVSNNRVQIGSGTGGGSPKMLGLDVKNSSEYVGQTCSTSGTLWYNSAQSMALVCENGIIRNIGNATTSIAAINANSGTPASAGTVVFSNGNGVSFGINGNTITASVAGGGATLSGYMAAFLAREHLAAQVGQSSLFFQPMDVPAAFQYDAFVQPLNWSNASNSSFSGTVSLYVGVYTRNVSTLSLASSASSSFAVTASGTVGSYSLYAGKKNYGIGWTNTITPGNYWVGMLSRTTTGGGAGMSWSNFVASNINTAASGNFSQASNASIQPILGMGSYSAQTAALPNSVAFTDIRGSAAANLRAPIYFFRSGSL